MELTQSDACISRRVRANELAESIKGKYRHEFVPSKRKRKKRKERSTLRATQCANNYTKSSRCVWMEFESSRTAFHFSPTRDICRSVTAFHRECSKLKSPVNRQLTVKVIINYYLTATRSTKYSPSRIFNSWGNKPIVRKFPFVQRFPAPRGIF